MGGIVPLPPDKRRPPPSCVSQDCVGLAEVALGGRVPLTYAPPSTRALGGLPDGAQSGGGITLHPSQVRLLP